LKDKFGLSWQFVPAILPELIGGRGEKTDRFMAAMMKMKKLDIEQFKKGGGGKVREARISQIMRIHSV
jgi:hypothetical protein